MKTLGERFDKVTSERKKREMIALRASSFNPHDRNMIYAAMRNGNKNSGVCLENNRLLRASEQVSAFEIYYAYALCFSKPRLIESI